MLHPLDWSLVPDLCRRVCVRLSVRLDPVRRPAHAARRRAGYPHHRLRQYRRHQCAAHRPQAARRRDARSATSSRARWRLPSLTWSSVVDAAICAALGAFLGHLFPVWLGFRGGKGVATYIGLLLGFQAWLAFAGVLRDLARDGGADPLFLARRADRQRRDARGAVVERRSADGGIVSAALGDAVDHAPRQYRAAYAAAPKARSAANQSAESSRVTPPPQRRRAPARHGCAGSCRRKLRRNDRFRPRRYAAATPRRNACARPDPPRPAP